MDSNSQGSGGLKAGLGGLFGGGAPEYSNTELAGVPCKFDVIYLADVRATFNTCSYDFIAFTYEDMSNVS